MKRNVLLLLLAVLVFYSCAPKSEHEPTTLTTQTENDTYLHHSIWWAFVNKVFDAKLSVAEMEKKEIVDKIGSILKDESKEFLLSDGEKYVKSVNNLPIG